VNTAVTTSAAGNTWDADMTNPATALCAAGQAGAQNTKCNAQIVETLATGVSQVEFDAPGVETFTGGVIEVMCLVRTTTNMADA
jgi:hypothetical protein